MSALWTAAEAIAATGGSGPGGWTATGVSIDSRTVSAGDLFVAIAGPRFDGHDFVAEALGKGAAAAMVHKRPQGLDEDAPLLLVTDTLEGLRGLARASRARCGAKVCAVTGSVGKTGTKEMLRLALSGLGATHASAGSLNNHWGVPLSLSRMARDASWAIFELGMNHAGEIGPLSRMVAPHVAIVTTVTQAHLEFFSSVEAIADAKAEIFEGMAAGGVAVLNRDNEYFERLAGKAAARGLEVVDFGRTGRRARLVGTAVDEAGMAVTAEIDGYRHSWRLGVTGEHWAANSLAAAAAVRAMGGAVDSAMAGLRAMLPPEGRGARHRVSLPGGGEIEIIDETYNASPASMKAALAALAGRTPGPGGRRIAVLGDMMELGDAAQRLHEELAETVRQTGIDLVFTAGRHMAALDAALPAERRGGHAADSRQLSPLVTQAVGGGDVVMIKGSAENRMGLILKALLGMTGASARSAAGKASGGAQ